MGGGWEGFRKAWAWVGLGMVLRVLLTASGWSWVALGWSNDCNCYLGQFGMALGVWECFGWFCDVSAKGGLGGFQDGLDVGGFQDGHERASGMVLEWSWVALGWLNACNCDLQQFSDGWGMFLGWFLDASLDGVSQGFRSRFRDGVERVSRMAVG